MSRQLNVIDLAECAVEYHGSIKDAIEAINLMLDSSRHTKVDIDLMIEVREFLREWAKA